MLALEQSDCADVIFVAMGDDDLFERLIGQRVGHRLRRVSTACIYEQTVYPVGGRPVAPPPVQIARQIVAGNGAKRGDREHCGQSLWEVEPAGCSASANRDGPQTG